MAMRSGTVPWNTLSGRSRGRPRKASGDSARSVGCVWPEGDATCKAPRAQDLALCAGHAEILSHSSGRCLWPGCIQSSYGPTCAYHDKIVHLLIDAPRCSAHL